MFNLSTSTKNLIRLILWLLCFNLICRSSIGARFRCSRPDAIQNGSYKLRRNLFRVSCNYGFTLFGPRLVDCVRGKWDGERPVCAKKGCSQSLIKPEFGYIEYQNEVASVFCLDNYIKAGNSKAYCNGTHWDRDIGTCRLRREETQHHCDFETEDLCGWSFMTGATYAWKRVMASDIFTTFNTGPRHDHTTLKANGGHYMLMESIGSLVVPAILHSPIYDKELTLKTACCFRFFYFMYGSGVGELYVLLRPVKTTLYDMLADKATYTKFHLSGNQNNMWNKHQFNIEELDDNFQIVFAVYGGRGHLSDIAIDDVSVLTGKDCDDGNGDDETLDSIEATERALFDVQSCEGRCFQANGTGVLIKDGKLTGLCNCHEECVLDESCCPDFKAICLSELYAQATTNQYSGNESTDESTILQTTPTTTTTTTTTKQPSTTRTTSTSTTTTTTTPKPTTTTTKRTTTATSTTPRTTTTTTTTSRKPPTTTRTTPRTTTTTTTTTTKRTTTTTQSTTPTRTTTTTTSTTTTTPKPTTTTTLKTTTKTTPRTTPKTTRLATFTTTTTTQKAETSTENYNTSITPSQATTTKIPFQNKTIWIVAANETSAFIPPHSGSHVLLICFVLAFFVVSLTAIAKSDVLRDWLVKRRSLHEDRSYVGSTNSILAKFIPHAKQGNEERKNGHKSKNKRKSHQYENAALISDDEDGDDGGACDYDGNMIVLAGTKPTTTL